METRLPDDFREFLKLLNSEKVEYLVVGGYAVSQHGYPRPTGDLDIWIDSTAENAARVYDALRAFGAPLTDLAPSELTQPDLVYQIGVPPRRIDVLTSLTGLSFEEAWNTKVAGRIGEIDCFFIGRDALIRNKRTLGRARDLADLEMLGE